MLHSQKGRCVIKLHHNIHLWRHHALHNIVLFLIVPTSQISRSYLVFWKYKHRGRYNCFQRCLKCHIIIMTNTVIIHRNRHNWCTKFIVYVSSTSISFGSIYIFSFRVGSYFLHLAFGFDAVLLPWLRLVSLASLCFNRFLWLWLKIWLAWCLKHTIEICQMVLS